MQARIAKFLPRNVQSEETAAIMAAEENKIALYERNAGHVSDGHSVAKKSAI